MSHDIHGSRFFVLSYSVIVNIEVLAQILQHCSSCLILVHKLSGCKVERNVDALPIFSGITHRPHSTCLYGYHYKKVATGIPDKGCWEMKFWDDLLYSQLKVNTFVFKCTGENSCWKLESGNKFFQANLFQIGHISQLKSSNFQAHLVPVLTGRRK